MLYLFVVRSSRSRDRGPQERLSTRSIRRGCRPAPARSGLQEHSDDRAHTERDHERCADLERLQCRESRPRRTLHLGPPPGQPHEDEHPADDQQPGDDQRGDEDRLRREAGASSSRSIMDRRGRSPGSCGTDRSITSSGGSTAGLAGRRGRRRTRHGATSPSNPRWKAGSKRGVELVTVGHISSLTSGLRREPGAHRPSRRGRRARPPRARRGFAGRSHRNA